MNIGNAIKQIRKEKNISQIALAEKCEISQTSLSFIERGVKRPTAKNLSKICKELNVSEPIIYILGTESADVPENKRELFEKLFPNIRELAISLME